MVGVSDKNIYSICDGIVTMASTCYGAYGKAIKIKCIKNNRDEQTVYQDLAGNVINVNDGNTFVNICPIAAKVVIEGGEETTPTTP